MSYKTTEQAAEEYIKPFAHQLHIGQEESVKIDFIAGAKWGFVSRQPEIDRLRSENERLRNEVDRLTQWIDPISEKVNEINIERTVVLFEDNSMCM